MVAGAFPHSATHVRVVIKLNKSPPLCVAGLVRRVARRRLVKFSYLCWVVALSWNNISLTFPTPVKRTSGIALNPDGYHKSMFAFSTNEFGRLALHFSLLTEKKSTKAQSVQSARAVRRLIGKWPGVIWGHPGHGRIVLLQIK